MAERYSENCLVVLGGGLDGESPNLQSRLRYDKALEIQQKFDHLILSSGWSYKVKVAGISEAEAGRNYMVERGVPMSKIITENLSKDTVSNAYHCRKIIDGFGVTDITMVTSAFHMKRARFIFEVVFPKGSYTLGYVKSDDGITGKELNKRKIHERLVLDFFKKHLFTTYGVTRGDMASIGCFLKYNNLATCGRMDRYQKELTDKIKENIKEKIGK
ncbi:MAG: YdcF family protein [Nanoarchaeota archaeon]